MLAYIRLPNLSDFGSTILALAKLTKLAKYLKIEKKTLALQNPHEYLSKSGKYYASSHCLIKTRKGEDFRKDLNRVKRCSRIQVGVCQFRQRSGNLFRIPKRVLFCFLHSETQLVANCIVLVFLDSLALSCFYFQQHLFSFMSLM